MKCTSLLIAALGLATYSAAWDVTGYPYVSDCNVASDGSYRVYLGTDSKTCHNMAGGDAGASCRQFTDGGFSHGDCSSALVTPASVLVSGSNQCKFYLHPGCTGVATTVEPGDENVCRSGAFQSWACVGLTALLNLATSFS
ncbi:hypothetical protein F5Y08DRAFT_340922 [Xylaria arbuscula]|uniref:Secreted LysM effector LysM C-terminal domain-containing protein n=1 Tax=Xylaria arbuscula TaxID=114810 RepID=A0A9W8NEG5_9PEZI|nr:hypothetical protein F5Y08DRAFT_340922 [Xylaria arbuscula]KAJ3571087.1 hypothetical protein NPX13_g5502 [Xylaria arbuscula]